MIILQILLLLAGCAGGELIWRTWLRDRAERQFERWFG